MKTIDFHNYKFNNWKKVEDNAILNKIDNKGGAVWFNSQGALCYRLSMNDSIVKTKNYKQANAVFSNYLDQNILLIDGKHKQPADLNVQDLKMVQSDIFNPFELKAFYEKNNIYYRNLFSPSKPLMLQKEQHGKDINIDPNIYKNDNQVPFEAIKRLIAHLINFNKERFDWLINWLAYFFQGIKKSQVALVLRGDQGTGKGIFFNEVIKPLFGSNYCRTINDKSLQSQYLGGLVENVIFFNLDEISHKKTESANIKNFLKVLVTNDTITVEKKFETLEKETKIHGQVLITSNEPYVLDIEQSDRRYTIFNTGKNLEYNNFLDYNSYEILSSNIKDQLNSFAQYLKNYHVNVPLANKALDTSEKDELKKINMFMNMEKEQRIYQNMQKIIQPIKVHPAIQRFSSAVRSKNTTYFSDITFDDCNLHDDIINDFNRNIFKIKNLLAAFKLLHGDELNIKHVSILLKKLREYDPHQFSHLNYIQYKQGDTTEDYLSILPYIYSQ